MCLQNLHWNVALWVPEPFIVSLSSQEQPIGLDEENIICRNRFNFKSKHFIYNSESDMDIFIYETYERAQEYIVHASENDVNGTKELANWNFYSLLNTVLAVILSLV